MISEYDSPVPLSWPWEEFRRLKLASGRELFLYDGRGRKASLSILLVGVKEAIPLLRDCLPHAVQQDNQEALTRFFKAAQGQ